MVVVKLVGEIAKEGPLIVGEVAIVVKTSPPLLIEVRDSTEGLVTVLGVEDDNDVGVVGADEEPD